MVSVLKKLVPGPLRPVAKKALILFRKYFPNRGQSLRTTVDWWDQWLRNKGNEWPMDYSMRLDPNCPVDEWQEKILDMLPEPEIRVLDVGCGAMTYFGKVHPHKKIQVFCCDQLATETNKLLKKYNLNPPVQPEACDTERLVEHYGQEKFHAVSARNCIDHCYDPVKAIEQMILVCRIGGVVMLRHAPHEGISNEYNDQHKWNFDLTPEGKVELSGRWTRVIVDDHFHDRVEFHNELSQGFICTHGIRKR